MAKKKHKKHKVNHNISKDDVIGMVHLRSSGKDEYREIHCATVKHILNGQANMTKRSKIDHEMSKEASLDFTTNVREIEDNKFNIIEG